MEEKEVQQILIEILCAEVNKAENTDSIKQKMTPDILTSVYRLAKKHQLSNTVSNFIYHNQISVDPELQMKLQREELISVYRQEQMKYTFKEICAIFDEAGLSYIPLKGAIIRPYYPLENMRTSCDIDILIHEDDLPTAISSLENKGYRCGKRHYHDVSLFSPNGIHLELHFSIQENMDRLDAVLKNAWDYAIPLEGGRHGFQPEFFVFHMYAHMAYHFVSGGCGIRALLDIWVMEHTMELSYSMAKELLEKAGIYQFAAEMSKFARRCFANNESEVIADPILGYIFAGGVYGSKINHIAVDKSKNQSSAFYFLKRMFPRYRSMIVLYPVLKRAPFLLPFCWAARWIKAVFDGKSQKIVSEISCVNHVSDEKISEVKEICLRLGLQSPEK